MYINTVYLKQPNITANDVREKSEERIWKT